MTRTKTFLIAIFAALALAATAQSVQAAAPVFTPGDCPFEPSLGNPNGIEIQCGTVEVPELHANPDGPTIQLAVAVLKATGPNPAPDPLIMAQGGPGGSTLDTYVDALLAKPEALVDRDVILFDQRGTLYSKPALLCPELTDLAIETLDVELSDEESNQRYMDALESCRTRLTDEGVNLAAFNSFENAADIDWVRQALGYDQVNYYGVSYGTLLGFHLLRTQPTWLRSAVLDAVVPPDINFIIDSPKSNNRSFSLLFESCAADADCNRAYPNLEEEFVALVDRLNENPIHITLTDPDTFEAHQALVNGDTVISLFFQMLYSTDLIPALPRTVYDLKAGRTDFFTRITEIIVFDRTMSEGMYYSVMCSEDSDFTLADATPNLQGIRPWLADGQEENWNSMLAACQNWRAVDLNPLADEPVTTDIPVLLLNGQFDPITPPTYGERAAQTLTHVTDLVFPGMGHGAFLSNACPTGITLSFLNDPQATPDSSCIAGLKPPAYITPKSAIDFPVILQALNLKPLALATLIAQILCVVWFGAAIIALPLAWLARLMDKERVARPHPIFARLAGWLPVLASLLLLGFLGGIAYFTVGLINDNNTILFFGLPASTRPLFALAILAALLLLASVWAAVLAWVKGWWSVAMRVYYSLHAVAALVSVVILAWWGALFPF